MGCTEGKCDGSWPVQAVRIARGFEVTKYQVTHEQWKEYTGKYRRESIPGPRHPALVRWTDAQEFIDRMNEKERSSYHYRLLTDAEWEYLARAGGPNASTEPSDQTRKFGQIIWKEEVVIEMPNIYAPGYQPPCGMDLGLKPCPTPIRFPNPWGLYDMLGDTPEWVADWYGPSKGGGRLERGGVLQWFLRGDGVAILLEPPRVWNKRVANPQRDRAGFRIVRQKLQ